MTRSVLKNKGQTMLPMVAAFIRHFPLSNNVAAPTSISVGEFDQWADKMGYYNARANRDIVNAARNNTRKRINLGACSPAWTVDEPSFHVRVKVHGVNYVVEPALDAFDAKVEKLPERVASVANTKYRALLLLKDSTDFASLPPVLQVRVAMAGQLAGRLLRDIQHAVDEVNREFLSLQHQLRILALPSANGGIKKMLSVDADDDEDEDADV